MQAFAIVRSRKLFVRSDSQASDWRVRTLMTLFTLLVSLAAAIRPASAAFTTLHSFEHGNANDLGRPIGTLAVSGSTVYGATVRPADFGATVGSVYRLGANGAGFQTMHSFSGFSGPSTGVTLFGDTLYGGDGNRPGLFSIKTDGSNYQEISSFVFYASGGDTFRSPNSDLVVHNGSLYGSAIAPASSGNSLLYRLNPSTGAVGSFGPTFGFDQQPLRYPTGTLALRGTTEVYGVLTEGYLYSNANGFTVLHDFSGSPVGGLAIDGSTLYGTVTGSIFKIGTDGTGFQTLHTFVGGTADGADAQSTLVQVGSKLFGTTNLGGTADGGTLFSINLDGSDFEILHSFGSTPGEGTSPGANNIFFAYPYLYGTTTQGGASNGGTVWSYQIAVVPEPSSLVLGGIAMLALLLAWRRRAA